MQTSLIDQTLFIADARENSLSKVGHFGEKKGIPKELNVKLLKFLFIDYLIYLIGGTIK